MPRRFGKLVPFRARRALRGRASRGEVLGNPKAAPGAVETYEYVEPEYGIPHFLPVERGDHELSEDCYCLPARGTLQGKGLVIAHFVR